jgi:MFS transporter, DHA1 family, multidrug resistance protein
VVAKANRLPISLVVSSSVFWLLALSFGIQPVTTDLYLPALPALAAWFQVDQRAIESTLQVYLLSYAAVQLFVGPLADRFGRRPILLGALALYAAGSATGFWANSLTALNAVRAVQAVGVCAVVIAARATVRDLLEPREGAALLAKALTVMGCIALVAPISGGYLLGYFSWQSCFLAMALYATFALVFAAMTFTETNRALNPHATELNPLFINYLAVTKHRVFLGYAIIAAAAYSALMIFFLKAPIELMQRLGLSSTEFGLCFSLCTIGFIAGTMIGRRTVTKLGIKPRLILGCSLCVSGGICMVGTMAFGQPTVATYMFCQFLYLLGHGVVQPISQAAAIGPFPEKAGAAGSVLGVMIHVGAFAWVALFSGAPASTAWPLGIFGASLIITLMVVLLAWQPRHA